MQAESSSLLTRPADTFPAPAVTESARACTCYSVICVFLRHILHSISWPTVPLLPNRCPLYCPLVAHPPVNQFKLSNDSCETFRTVDLGVLPKKTSSFKTLADAQGGVITVKHTFGRSEDISKYAVLFFPLPPAAGAGSLEAEAETASPQMV